MSDESWVMNANVDMSDFHAIHKYSNFLGNMDTTIHVIFMIEKDPACP